MENTKSTFTHYFVPVLLLLVGASIFAGLSALASQLQKAQQVTKIQTVLSYHDQAEKLNDYYFTVGEKTRVASIRATLVAIDRYLPQQFPDGPYTRKDIMALAMSESAFDQYLIGTKKEFGIFQIMPEMCTDLGIHKNQFDINVNTEMALQVLKSKYSEHKDYKKSIIAYNGYFFKKNGKLYDAYWKRFLKYRSKLDDIFPDTIK